MKTIIFSDTHLTSVFDEPKFHYLKKLFTSCDRLIVNGDFWDGYETTFQKFSNSKWNQLFPLMIEKKAVFLYGNHDKKEWTKNPTVFSTKQADSISLTVGKETLVVEHGHRLSPSFDISYPKLSVMLSTFFSSKRLQFGRKLHGWENMQMKHFAKRELKRNQILVCGHSHIAEYNPKDKYINTGVIDFGVASYLRIVDQEISLVMETYG
jgi:predicted phosphodiesterase